MVAWSYYTVDRRLAKGRTGRLLRLRLFLLEMEDKSAVMNCPKCKITMLPGVAIEETLTGIPDFPGDDLCVTVSPGGPGRLIKCLKCPECGYSVTNLGINRFFR